MDIPRNIINLFFIFLLLAKSDYHEFLVFLLVLSKDLLLSMFD